MSRIYNPKIFKKFPEVSAGLSTRHVTSPAAYSLRMFDRSKPQVILDNQADFTSKLGFIPEDLIIEDQQHGEDIAIVTADYKYGQADALLTNLPGKLLAVSIADCAGTLIYDPAHQAIGAVHTGWRGLKLGLITRALAKMNKLYGTKASEVYVYVSPTAGQCCYEVGPEVAGQFDAKYNKPKNDKFMLDLKSIATDQLASAGVPLKNMEIDPHCTIHEPRYHSYRRDGERAGLMLAAIGLK